jgi:hypothetical protein
MLIPLNGAVGILGLPGVLVWEHRRRSPTGERTREPVAVRKTQTKKDRLAAGTGLGGFVRASMLAVAPASHDGTSCESAVSPTKDHATLDQQLLGAPNPYATCGGAIHGRRVLVGGVAVITVVVVAVALPNVVLGDQGDDEKKRRASVTASER